MPLGGIGYEPARVGGIRHDSDPVAGRAVPDELAGDVLGRHEDPVGQLDVAEPTLVQPGHLPGIDLAAAEIDREEVRSGLGLDLHHPALLADVAVDHAQHRCDAEWPARGQGELRGDVAEEQCHARTVANQGFFDDPVESSRPPSGEPQPDLGMARRESALGRQGQVEAPVRPDPSGRDLRLVTTSQLPLKTVEATGGDPPG